MARLQGKEREAVCQHARAYLTYNPLADPGGGDIWQAASGHGAHPRLTRLAFRIATRFQQKWRMRVG